MSKNKISLGALLTSSCMSPDVAERIFGGVAMVEVEVDTDVMATEPGGLAGEVAALHAAIEAMFRTAPNNAAVREFLEMYAAHERHTLRYLAKLLEQENPEKPL